MQSMQENFHKEFCLEDKYGQPKIPLPIPNDIQRLKKRELFVGELNILFMHVNPYPLIYDIVLVKRRLNLHYYPLVKG